MKKSQLNIVAGVVVGLVGVFVSTKLISAQVTLPRISTVCESTYGEITAINDGFSLLKRCPKFSRLALITGDPGPAGPQGEKGPQGIPGVGLELSKVYTKVDGPFSATKGVASTIIHGCNSGDLSLSGGMYTTSGAVSNWVTVKSAPGPMEPSDASTTVNSWSTTVINQVEAGTFYTITKCIKL